MTTRAFLLALALLPVAACDELPFASDDPPPSDDVVQLSAASRHACARLRDGRVLCWGDNTGGRLGDGTQEPRFEAVAVRLPGRATWISASHGGGCAVVESRIYCWGTDPRPAADGDGEVDTVLVARQVGEGHRWRSVTAPADAWNPHLCALDTADRAWCWGYNWSGQLGDGTRDDATDPVPVSGDLRWRSISVHWGRTCGITTTGEAYCWGYNFGGELGIGSVDPWIDQGTNRPLHIEPTLVAGGHRWIEIEVNAGGACGLASTGVSYCWGHSIERPEIAAAMPTHTPFPIGLAGDEIATRGAHACVAGGGVIGCWGDNRHGQLGLGHFDAPLSPELLTSGDAYIAVETGDAFTCAITASRDVDCWGANGTLQLADGTAMDRPSPVRIELD